MLRRSAKSKGNQFEYEVEFNLRPMYENIFLTKERGFVRQYDLCDDTAKLIVECKFHRSISWNEAEKIFKKLIDKSPEGFTKYLIYKTNRQPVLVMYDETSPKLTKFSDFFNKPFILRKDARGDKNE